MDWFRMLCACVLSLSRIFNDRLTNAPVTRTRIECSVSVSDVGTAVSILRRRHRRRAIRQRWRRENERSKEIERERKDGVLARAASKYAKRILAMVVERNVPSVCVDVRTANDIKKMEPNRKSFSFSYFFFCLLTSSTTHTHTSATRRTRRRSWKEKKMKYKRKNWAASDIVAPFYFFPSVSFRVSPPRAPPVWPVWLSPIRLTLARLAFFNFLKPSTGELVPLWCRQQSSLNAFCLLFSSSSSSCSSIISTSHRHLRFVFRATTTTKNISTAKESYKAKRHDCCTWYPGQEF